MNTKKLNLFLSKISFTIFITLILYLFCGCSDEELVGVKEHYVPSSLENSSWEMYESPEKAGWSTLDLLNAYNYSTKNLQTAAVMIIYKGKVVYHWGNLERKYWVHSCRKSFMSALYGIAVDEKRINLSKTLLELNIDDKNPALNETEKTATVDMLLKARSGVYHEAAAEAASMKTARPTRNSHLPGTYWYYNNWDFNALCTIYENETSGKFYEDLKTKIAEPIGMEDFLINDGNYSYENCSIHPAYPFRMSARDMARFGQLYLQKGIWDNQQIISEEWINKSITPYSKADDFISYGYMWWVIDTENSFAPKGSYFAAGYNGHYILIIPKEEIVIVHRVNTDINNAVSSLEFSTLVQLIMNAKR